MRSAIEEEVKLKLTVRSDLVLLTRKFEIMQSFLNVAEAERCTLSPHLSSFSSCSPSGALSPVGTRQTTRTTALETAPPA